MAGIKLLDLETTTDLSDVYTVIKKAGWIQAKKVLASEIYSRALQVLNYNNHKISISQGNEIDISDLLQSLGLNDFDLSISERNSVNLSKFFSPYYCSELTGYQIDDITIHIDAFACTDRQNKNLINFPGGDISFNLSAEGWYYIFIDTSLQFKLYKILGNPPLNSRRIGAIYVEDVSGNLRIKKNTLILSVSKNFLNSILKVRKIYPQGQHGGDAVQGWNLWDITNLDYMNIPGSIVDLVNDKITLPAGKYKAYIQTAIYQIRARACLITSDDNELIATNYSNYSGVEDGMLNTEGIFELTDTTDIYFKIQSKTSNTTDGLGRAANESGKDEFYGVVLIEKIG